jgi:hypothetical protein
LFWKTTTASKNAAKDSSSKVEDVWDALPTVLRALPTTNVSTVKNRLSFMVVPVTTLVLLAPFQTDLHSSASLAILHARLVSTIQVHVQAASQVMVTSNSLETHQVVSRNALKELSHEMVFARFATSSAPNVWDRLPIALLVQSTLTCTMELAGTTALVSCPMELALTLVLLVTSRSTIGSAGNAARNAVHVTPTQLV